MKEKLKVYHGLPKPPIMSNTLLYSSLDMDNNPTIGLMNGTITSVVPSPYGYGANDSTGVLTFHLDEPTDCFTLDLFVSKFYAVSSGNKIFLDFLTESGERTFSIQAPSQSSRLTLVSVSNSGWQHINNEGKDSFIRLCVTKSNIDVYIDGVLTHSSSVYSFDKPISKLNLTLRSTHIPCSVSHLCVTKGILGDYFPTLPQDYIDGKAIVVPALNQRQSYGDPILHQVTELLVPKTETGQYYPYSNTADSDGLFPSLFDPELATYGANTWNSGSKLKITGLNNSIITGVFDTDTALCRVVEKAESLTNTDITVKVDDVSRLNVGDTVRIFNSNLVKAGSYDYQIGSIDTSSNSITILSVGANTVIYVGDFLFETTASSSSPVVKTVDGTTVNGTWSGLGTTSATFTFGENSNIAGKDLVVTYCLSAVGNSSPYPKMPSEVIRGYDKLGNELVPVTSVAIQDDFKRKIAGSIKECPHSLKYALDSVLRLPSHHWNEFTQSYYNTSPSIASHIQGHRAQILVEVDLVRFVENKMGVEIPGNKLNWLNANVKSIKCSALVIGNSNNSKKCYIKFLNDNANSWGLNSSGATCDSTEPTLIQGRITPNGSYLKSTKYYFLIHSDALSVTGNDAKSRVILHDVQLELTLNTDERYDYLYTKNLASREGYCNPILVDKQTKEVKRLLPSTAPFSTEVIVHNPTTPNTPTTKPQTVCRSTEGLLTTLGSGSSRTKSDIFRGLIGKLGLDSSKYTNETVCYLSQYTSDSAANQGIKHFMRQAYFNSVFSEIAGDDIPVGFNSVSLCPEIAITENHELVLICRTSMFDGSKNRTEYKRLDYLLPNRPLIK